MRIIHLIKGDIVFQIKYGFYFLYVVFTVLYAFVLVILPETWQETVASLMIYSDPAAMGLFFMGAIVLFEKSQRVLNSLAVSPIHISEYILSKIISLALISEIVAMILAVISHHQNLIMVFIGTLLSSFIFSLLGLIVSTKIHSLNQFILWTVPVEILCFVPPLASIFIENQYLMVYPMTHCLSLINGKSQNDLLSILIVVFMLVCLWKIAVYMTKKMWKSVGGVHL